MKILLLLPDGVGVRNFIYTDFIDRAIGAGHEIIAWADEDILSLIDDGRITKISLPEGHFVTKITEIRRKAWQNGMLKWWAKKFKDDIYLEYIIRQNDNTLKGNIKNLSINLQTLYYTSHKKLNRLRKKYLAGMIRLPYYQKCLEQLQTVNPDVLFCTHQRALNAVAPLFAARSLNIPNACFIYSWDNLPKATLFVDADNYFVWSEHMKNELLKYHNEIKPENVIITGTPQFTTYYNDSIKISRERFASENSLPADSRWICYSGDDTRTSPFDPIYLMHLAEAVREWNKKSENRLHIVFRRCPVDLSDRFDEVLNLFNDVITPISPHWDSVNKNAAWDRVVPRKEDTSLLVNTALHCDMVINVGSTMAFDFNIFGKPALFINYNASINSSWDIHTIYKFTHFRSMNNLQPVLWINSKEDIPEKIKEAYSNNSIVEDCTQWLQKIAVHPLEKANERIIDALNQISERCISAS